MNSLETLETLLAQIKRGDEEKDPNLVINSLESISLLADEMRKSVSEKKEEQLLEDIKKTPIVKSQEQNKSVFSKMSEQELEGFKSKLYNTVEKEEEQLQSVGEVNEQTTDPNSIVVQKIDSKLLDGFNIKAQANPSTVCRLDKEDLDLLRQEIDMRKNTVSAQALLSSVMEEWKNTYNPSTIVEEKPYNNQDLRDTLVEKRVLKTVSLDSKQATSKTPIVRKSGAEIIEFKDKLYDEIEKIKQELMQLPSLEEGVAKAR